MACFKISLKLRISSPSLCARPKLTFIFYVEPTSTMSPQSNDLHIFEHNLVGRQPQATFCILCRTHLDNVAAEQRPTLSF